MARGGAPGFEMQEGHPTEGWGGTQRMAVTRTALSESSHGSLLLFPQVVDAEQKPLDCFLQRNGAGNFFIGCYYLLVIK